MRNEELFYANIWLDLYFITLSLFLPLTYQQSLLHRHSCTVWMCFWYWAHRIHEKWTNLIHRHLDLNRIGSAKLIRSIKMRICSNPSSSRIPQSYRFIVLNPSDWTFEIRRTAIEKILQIRKIPSPLSIYRIYNYYSNTQTMRSPSDKTCLRTKIDVLNWTHIQKSYLNEILPFYRITEYNQ